VSRNFWGKGEGVFACRKMAPMLLLVTATKVVGVMGALTVAANVLAYRHFHKKNLAPFENPIDESQELLASFPIDKDGSLALPIPLCFFLKFQCDDRFHLLLICVCISISARGPSFYFSKTNPHSQKQQHSGMYDYM
jgi:hypothetical protein